MNTVDFRLQIKVLMERKKVSASKLSRLADLNSGTVYKYLSGKTEISAANLEKLFNGLNAIEEPKSQKGAKHGNNDTTKRRNN